MSWKIISEKLEKNNYKVMLKDSFGEDVETYIVETIGQRTSVTKSLAMKYSHLIVKIEHHE